ncbi:MAG: rod shape-determining protein MreD [Nitrosospira sp.]
MAFANHPRQEILRPVKGSFIVFSLMAALLLNLLPLKDALLTFWPDFAALTILYWCINQPQRAGMSTAFGMGLLMDIGNASTFGQHALAYSIMAFVALLFHRRLHNFGLLQQAPQMGLILLIGQSVMLLTWLLDGFDFPGWDFFLASATGTVLWPLLSSLLRIPQRPRSDSNALS